MITMWLPCLAAAVLISANAVAADLPGSKDPPGFKRFEGSEIIDYRTSPYEQYFLARGEGAIGEGFTKEERVEGALVKVVYRVPGASSLEIFRNYEQMLDDLEFEPTFKLDKGTLYYLSAKDFHQRFYFQAGYLQRKAHENTPFQDGKNQYYITGKRVRDGQTVWVAVYVAESDGLKWSDTAQINKGEPVVGVDVITSRQINYRMVEVKADELAQSLASDGKVDLYGILFDIDKTTLKPESRAVLDEVAKLLKSDPALRLEIAGHTDNTGASDHNRKLSAGRAAAVVNSLVANYGIEAGRLQPQGYADSKPVASNETDQGRAKNRRVELRKL